MIRPIAALLLAGCLVLPMWAQEPAPGAPLAQTPTAPDQAPAGQMPATAPPAAQTSGTRSAPFPPDRFREFSAIQVSGMLPGEDWEGHVYRSGDLMRMQAVTGGKSQYFVDDLVKGTSYGLSTGGCAKLPYLYSRTYPFLMTGPTYTYEVIPVGEDTVNGHHCHVEDVTVRAAKLANPAHFRVYEADDLQGFPIKIVNQQKKIRQWVIEYKNVVLGPQDPTLFVVPRDCQDLKNVPIHPGGSPAKPKEAPGDKPN